MQSKREMRATWTSRCLLRFLHDGVSARKSFSAMSGVSNDLLVSLSMNFNNDGTTHAHLIENLKKNNLIKSSAVESAMLKVDRGDYVEAKDCYSDKPHKIGCNATISSPHMHAIALEALRDALAPGKRALDVGSGSGYVAACMAMMVGETGAVYGVEHERELVKKSAANAGRAHTNLQFIEGNGYEGLPHCAPFDCIHVGAAVDTIPTPLLDQLVVGGKLLIPISQTSLSPSSPPTSPSPDNADAYLHSYSVSATTPRSDQQLMLVEKTPHGVVESPVMTCVYSPLQHSPLPKVATMTKEELLAEQQELANRIAAWQNNFKTTHNRKPTSLEMIKDEEAGAVFKEYQQCSKLLSKFLNEYHV